MEVLVTTKRLVIRSPKLADYKAWFDANTQAQPSQSPWDRPTLSSKQANKIKFQSLLRRFERNRKKDFIYVWWVFEKQTGKLVGALDIMIICRHQLQTANLGYKLYNQFWGRRYGREFVKKSLPAVFKKLSLNRLEASIDPQNIASIKLAKSVKMTSEGLRRKYWHLDKKWSDQLVFSAIREDYGLAQLRL